MQANAPIVVVVGSWRAEPQPVGPVALPGPPKLDRVVDVFAYCGNATPGGATVRVTHDEIRLNSHSEEMLARLIDGRVRDGMIAALDDALAKAAVEVSLDGIVKPA